MTTEKNAAGQEPESLERREKEWRALQLAITQYSADYEYGDGGYCPTADELLLCDDFVQGLLSDNAFIKAIAQVYPVRTAAPVAPQEPTEKECEAAGRGPMPAGFGFKEGGLSDTPQERKRFEAYMRGHCWSIGEYDAVLRAYDTVLVRMLYGVWRDRGALAVPASAAAPLYRCVSCGFEDTKPLRDGVNNHWRKGYVPGLRPTSWEAFCYAGLKLVEDSATTLEKEQP